jgi:hypothetical protein
MLTLYITGRLIYNQKKSQTIYFLFEIHEGIIHTTTPV